MLAAHSHVTGAVEDRLLHNVIARLQFLHGEHGRADAGSGVRGIRPGGRTQGSFPAAANVSPRIWWLLLGRWLYRRVGYLAELIAGRGLSRIRDTPRRSYSRAIVRTGLATV